MFIISATEFLFISVVRSSSQLDFRLSRYAPTSQLRTQDDAKEWLRSHSAGGLQDTAANSPFSSGSSVTSPSGTRFNFSQLASPTTVTQMSLSNPTMLRTHSLSNADGQYDPYTDSRFRNSSMSLDEKSRTMSRSGSFRDGFEEVHGSSLSLVSSTSSIYSTVSMRQCCVAMVTRAGVSLSSVSMIKYKHFS